MDEKTAIKIDSAAQRLESPLDVLSRAASMIQKETSRMVYAAKDGLKRDGSTDSGFEDNFHGEENPKSPSKVHNSGSVKMMVQKEKRERRIQERKSTNGAFNMNAKEAVRKDMRKEEDDRIRPLSMSGSNKWKGEHAICAGELQKQNHVELSYHKNPVMNLHFRGGMKQETQEHKEKCYQMDEEREHRGFRYPQIPPPPLISLHPHPFSWLPPPYPSPLSLVRRQSVITSASCPQQFPPDGMSLCPCIDPKCNIKKYPFGKHLSSPTGMKREVFSAVPPGFELPTVEEHFRKSLGSDYEDMPVPVESLNSVDEHFAKALGNTWYNIKYQKCAESPYRTRDRVLSGCNL